METKDRVRTIIDDALKAACSPVANFPIFMEAFGFTRKRLMLDMQAGFAALTGEQMTRAADLYLKILACHERMERIERQRPATARVAEMMIKKYAEEAAFHIQLDNQIRAVIRSFR